MSNTSSDEELGTPDFCHLVHRNNGRDSTLKAHFSRYRCLSVLSAGEAFLPRWMLHEAARPHPPSQTFKDVGEPLILTPLIEAGDLKKAREAARVDPEALQPGLDIESYSGFLTVDKKYNSNLFFWYFPALPDSGGPVEKTPWIIWLQGGPGASSLFGLFTEIGPFRLTPNNTLEKMPYSWHLYNGLLFIDNPVGTGFSFTDDGGYATNQTTIGEHLYIALQQFLTVFSELRTAPLTIFGESYGGKHVPSLAMEIHQNKKTDESINLFGIAVGNGFVDPESLMKYSDFLLRIGLHDDKQAGRLKELEEQTVKTIQNGDLQKARELYFEHQKEMRRAMGNSIDIYNFLKDVNPGDTTEHDLKDFLTSEQTRKALHVGNTEYYSFNKLVFRKITDFMGSAKPWVEELLEHYKVMLYNGHLDIIVPYYPSVSTYKSFNFSAAEEYQTAPRLLWLDIDGEFVTMSGYMKFAGNFVDVMVRGAGHMSPTDQPLRVRNMAVAFSHGLLLPPYRASDQVLDRLKGLGLELNV